jgi:hypothetical protein
VPVTAPLRTLRDCIEANVASDLVQQGILQARRRGIVSAKDEARLIAKLGIQPAQRRNASSLSRRLRAVGTDYSAVPRRRRRSRTKPTTSA